MDKKDWIKFGICSLLLASCKAPAPAPVFPVPTPEQVEWQKKENYAFVHFGLNTFNDLEWGYGDTPAASFNPTHLDCEQWVRIVKAAGMKGVILTAKHHDGFCLWPTKTVDYNISKSPYKNGHGDMVKELSDACKKYNLEFGLYLSPWDRHHAEYGREAYQKVYHEQIRELITNYGPLFEFWFDGANGGNGWYGGANEIRSIDPQTYYGYETAREMIKARHPKAMIFGGTVPDIRWIGNELGWAGETCWAMYDEARASHHRQSQWGMEDGTKWLPGECDVSIRPGWFYHHREDHQVRTVPNLVDLYYKSVGHNANFLLNFPIALTGQIHPTDSANAVDFYRTIQAEFQHNLLAGIRPEASNDRGFGYAANNVTDDDWDSYWATEDGVTAASLTFLLPKGTSLNRIMVQEYIPLGQRVCAFSIEVENHGQWTPVETTDTLTTVGYKRLVRFKTTPAEALRINFKEARGPLCVNNVEAFLAPTLLEQPSISRNAENEVSIGVLSPDAKVYYTLDGTTPTEDAAVYVGPFILDRKATVKAAAYDATTKKWGPVAMRQFDIPARYYTVVSPRDKHTSVILDGSGRTAYYLPQGKREVIFRLDQPRTISGFLYTPNQSRDANGHISHYELLIDGKKVVGGEFSNIRNNPIEQEVRFAPVKGQQIVFRCLRTAGDVHRIGIGEFSVITE